LQPKSSRFPENDHPRIDPELWVRFHEADTPEAFARAWLALQCALIPGAVQGVLILAQEGGGGYAPVARWPEQGEEDPVGLAEISERALEEQCGLILELGSETGGTLFQPPRYGAAYPVLVDEELLGVVAVDVAAETEEDLARAMTHLQWGVSWLEVLVRRRRMKEDAAALERLRAAVDLLAAVLSEERFERACMGFVTELATVLGCDRVSMGFTHRGRVRIRAVSHSAEFGKRMNLIRAIGTAMDEAVSQRKELFFPSRPGEDPTILRDHEHLARQHGAGCILTLPFYAHDRYYGALTLERPLNAPFSEEEAEFCRSVASLLFPALETKRRDDRMVIVKALDALGVQLGRLLGPRYLGRKLIVLLLAGAVAFLALKETDFTISSDVTLEGEVRRAVVAPFDGYVKEGEARAGDVVKEGDVLCLLDDRDLRLERLNWLSKRTQYQRQVQEAVAEHNRAETKIIQAQLEQSEAQLELVENRLKRTRLRAPISGLLLSGDLTQRLDGAVTKGEVLFEVAPLDAYRVILRVDERRVADVAVGQEGRMILSALPRETFNFVVEKITPITEAEEGKNAFRVEAKLAGGSLRLRPGMEGVGKIPVDRRPIGVVWTQGLRDWFVLWTWSWWP